MVAAFAALLLSGGLAAQQGQVAESPHRLSASESEAARAGAPYRMFSAWLDAMNAADPARLGEFLEKHYAQADPQGLLRLRDLSDGLDLRALDEAGDANLAGLVQERNSDNFLRFAFTLKSGQPDQIESLDIRYVARPADFPPPRLTEPEIFSALDAKLIKDAASGRFSGAVLVTRHGKVVYRKALGLADRDRKIPNTLDTRFDIGSMNKMFTATAIMQLVQNGRVGLSDPLGKYLPDYPNPDIARKVTIEQLLSHQGGTGDVFGPEFEAHRLELRTHDDYVKLFGQRGPVFEPGTRFEYSNYGMVLLGAVIERVTRQSYFDYVDRHIFRPAGMTHTASEPIDRIPPGTAIGYMRSPDGGGQPNFEVLPYRGTAAGGGRSTVGDLAKFAEALTHNKLLSAANTRLMTTRKVTTPNGNGYGFGFVDQREQQGYFGHDGGGPGLSGILMVLPESGYVVAVLSNIDPPYAGRIGNYVTLRLVNRVEPATSSRP